MGWFKRYFGLDLFDTAVHVAVTGLVMVMASSQAYGRTEEMILSMIAGSSIVVFSIRRRHALKHLPPEAGQLGMTTGQMAAERLEELEMRVAQLEAAEARIVELEERLDFTERMLAQASGERPLLERGEARRG